MGGWKNSRGWVYWESSPHTWTVAYNDHGGITNPVADYFTEQEAWKRAKDLNDGCHKPESRVQAIPEINHRDLLKRYIDWLGRNVGTTLIHSGPNADSRRFSDEEWAELQVLNIEDIDEVREEAGER